MSNKQNNLKKLVNDFCKERGWDDQPPGDIAKSIVIESAELLEHFQWSSFFSEDVSENPEVRKKIIEELADVFVYATEMALVLDCDIYDIVKEKLDKAAKKYPAEKIKGKLGSAEYRKIKEDYRKKK